MEKFNTITITIQIAEPLDRRGISNVLAGWVEEMCPIIRSTNDTVMNRYNKKLHGTLTNLNILIENN